MPEIQSFTQNSDWNSWIIESAVPRLVEFYSPYVGEPCEEMYQTIKKLHKQFGDKILFHRYNMDKLQYNAKQMTVEGVPYVILFKPWGKVFERVEGFVTPEWLKPKMEKLLAACYG